MSFLTNVDQAQNHPATAVKPLDTIRSYHAHIYFEGPEQRSIAETLREEISQRFPVLLGRWHDRLVGPHARPMYLVAFAPVEFARLVPWLMINRRGLAVLIHPNTGHPRRNHVSDAIWLGGILDINAGHLPEYAQEAEPEIIPNTHPAVTP